MSRGPWGLYCGKSVLKQQFFAACSAPDSRPSRPRKKQGPSGPSNHRLHKPGLQAWALGLQTPRTRRSKILMSDLPIITPIWRTIISYPTKRETQQAHASLPRASAPCNGASLPRASAPCNGASLPRASAPCNGASLPRASAPCNGCSMQWLLHAMAAPCNGCSMQW